MLDSTLGRYFVPAILHSTWRGQGQHIITARTEFKICNTMRVSNKACVQHQYILLSLPCTNHYATMRTLCSPMGNFLLAAASIVAPLAPMTTSATTLTLQGWAVGLKVPQLIAVVAPCLLQLSATKSTSC